MPEFDQRNQQVDKQYNINIQSSPSASSVRSRQRRKGRKSNSSTKKAEQNKIRNVIVQPQRIEEFFSWLRFAVFMFIGGGYGWHVSNLIMDGWWLSYGYADPVLIVLIGMLVGVVLGFLFALSSMSGKKINSFVAWPIHVAAIMIIGVIGALGVGGDMWQSAWVIGVSIWFFGVILLWVSGYKRPRW